MNSSPARRQRLSARSATLATIVAASAALLIGCSNTADGSTSTPASTSSRAPKPATTGAAPATSSSHPGTTAQSRGLTRTWTPPQQQVIDAYRTAMDAYDLVLRNPPNPDDPALAATTVDPVKTEVHNLAAKWLGFGQALRYPANSVHRIDTITVDVQPAGATIETCNIDDGVVYSTASGNVLNDKVTTARDGATLTRLDGTWKLSTRVQLQKWEGVAGCATGSS